jgi:hypothetical protein
VDQAALLTLALLVLALQLQLLIAARDGAFSEGTSPNQLWISPAVQAQGYGERSRRRSLGAS